MNHVIFITWNYESKEKTVKKLELDDLDLEEDEVEAKTEMVEVFLPAEERRRKNA